MAETTEVTKEETKTEEKAVKETEETEAPKEEKEESIYQGPLPNRIIVSRNHPLSYYADRARRILRMEDKLFVSGRGNTISMACTLVEVLKRQKIGKVVSISTGMNVEPFFNANGDARWSDPTAMITFSIERDVFAQFVADYQQRKVIEIFEEKDSAKSGKLGFDDIDSLKLSERFRANDEQIESAKKFMSDQKEKTMDLPTFIKYVSLLIHPLLKDKVFKNMLAEFEEKPKAKEEEAEAAEPVKAES